MTKESGKIMCRQKPFAKIKCLNPSDMTVRRVHFFLILYHKRLEYLGKGMLIILLNSLLREISLTV